MRRVGRADEAGGAESGYSLVVLLAAIAIMMILLAAAVPSWRYVMKNDREEELIFRGGEIADAIARYQQRNGNALPASLDVLVKGKFLRHAYKDPMTKDGKWRLLRPGELVGATGQPAPGLHGPFASTTTTTTTTRPSAFSPAGTVMGGFQGVVSTSTETSLRLFNGRSKYSEWVFLPGQPRIVGKPIGVPIAPGAAAGGPFGRPGARPLPRGAPGAVNPQTTPYVVPP